MDIKIFIYFLKEQRLEFLRQPYVYSPENVSL